MLKRTRKYRYKNNIVISHIKVNFNIYIILFILFIIGLFAGIAITNNLSDDKKENISNCIQNSINSIKNENRVYKKEILKKSIIKNIIIILLIWICGLTFFGKYVLFIYVLFIGLTFGYTASAITIPYNINQSIILLFSSLLLQNIVSIPTIFFLCVQGIKCHNDLNDRSYKTSIQNIIIKFTSNVILGTMILVMSSLIETYISSTLLINVIKYI